MAKKKATKKKTTRKKAKARPKKKTTRKKAGKKVVKKAKKKTAKKKTAKKKTAKKKTAKKKTAKEQPERLVVVGLPSWLVAIIDNRKYRGHPIPPGPEGEYRLEVLDRYAASGFRSLDAARALLDSDRRSGFDPLNDLKRLVVRTWEDPVQNWWSGTIKFVLNGKAHEVSYPGTAGYALDAQPVGTELNDLLNAVVEAADGYPVLEDVRYSPRRIPSTEIGPPPGYRGSYGIPSGAAKRKEEEERERERRRAATEAAEVEKKHVVEKLMEARRLERSGNWAAALAAYQQAKSWGEDVPRHKFDDLERLVSEEEEWQAWRAGEAEEEGVKRTPTGKNPWYD